MKFKSFIFENLLLEDKVAFILDKQGEKVLAAYEKDRGQGKPKNLDSEGVIKTLVDWSAKYLQWLVNSYIEGQFSLEDKGRLQSIINDFDKYRRKLDKKDLSQYKDITDIEKAVASFTEEDAKSNKQLEREREAQFFKDKDAKIFYEGGGLKIIIPKTKDASCYFGRGTKWCTAATSAYNAFEDYSKKGSLYIVLTDDGRKYQFFFRVGQQQMMDEKDHSIKSEMSELIKKYPAMITAFETVAKKSGYLPLIKDPSDADYLKAIKNEPRDTLYDLNILKRQLPSAAAELAAKTNPRFVAAFPNAFSKEFALSFYKTEKGDLVVDWLKKMIGKVTEKEFKDLLNVFIKDGHYSLHAFIKTIFDEPEMNKIYGKLIKEISVEDKKKIIQQEHRLTKYFEDDLSEKEKIDLINDEPDWLKSFEKPTNKMKQAAQWAEDRIKRKTRGF